jgi:glycerol-3-phosphate dehydrogenase
MVRSVSWPWNQKIHDIREAFMADNKLIIIGGGIAGLATGCYARMNGYDVEVFEMHNLPGGCAHLQLL